MRPAARDDWKKALRDGANSPEALGRILAVDPASLCRVTERYPMRINAYFLDLMQAAGEPLIRQVVPDPIELEDKTGLEDPLAEDRDSPVPLITHRYPDRVLFYVTAECAVYCRFCTRKRKVGRGAPVTVRQIEDGIRYIRGTRAVRDVLVSGGDPLMLSDERLGWLLRKLHEIPHVEVIRVGTRIPCVLPSRVTPQLASVLKKIRPLYVNVHFNHPAEITGASRRACARLADSGAVLGNQTVLLRGINDDAGTLETLFRGLLTMRVRPYYLLQADLTRGTDHFRTPVETGLAILKRLRGRVSGLMVPHFIVDLPRGGGKVPLVPDYVIETNDREWKMRNYLDRPYTYPQPID
jgi:lysine 2,3-aminomutase